MDKGKKMNAWPSEWAIWYQHDIFQGRGGEGGH